MLNTKIWSDSWIRQKLNPLDRYLFIYFLTNAHTSICGIYELPIEIIAFETGLDENDLNKSLLPRLKPKIMYKNNYVIIPNFIKHQNCKSPKVITGIMAEISHIPEIIMDIAIGYGYPMDTISHLNSNSNSNSNTNPNINKVYETFKKKINKGSQLTSKAKEKIKIRLKVFSVEELLQAIENFSKDSWWMEHNSNRGVAWFFHTDERIDQLINLKPREKLISEIK